MKYLYWGAFWVLVTILPILVESKQQSQDEERPVRILSRKRRYLTFPEGSSFSMAACLTVGVLGNPMPGIFTWGLNWGIAYELPNETMLAEGLKRVNALPRPLVARRDRRDLYSKLELIMTDMGYNGRECIFRALCEASQRLLPRGGTMIEQLFRKIFTFPMSKVRPAEPAEHHLYDRAHRNGLEDLQCWLRYETCPVSLLDMALGHYTPNPLNSNVLR